MPRCKACQIQLREANLLGYCLKHQKDNSLAEYNLPPYLVTSEIADILGLGGTTQNGARQVTDWCVGGDVVFKKPGRAYKIPRSQLSRIRTRFRTGRWPLVPQTSALSVSPDLLTPGEDEESIRHSLMRHCDGQDVNRIITLSNEATTALTHGNFEQQTILGTMFQRIGSSVNSRFITSLGLYLQGEGARFTGKTRAAKEYYEWAVDEDPQGIRGHRGLAIVLQADGYLSEAGEQYKIADTLLESRDIWLTSPEYATHERVRVDRHWGNMLSQMSNKEKRTSEFHSLLRRLNDYIPTIAAKPGLFWGLDLFKCYVFSAETQASIYGRRDAVTKQYASAIYARKPLIDYQGAFSSGDEQGLFWLSQSMHRAREIFTAAQRSTHRNQIANAINVLVGSLGEPEKRRATNALEGIAAD